MHKVTKHGRNVHVVELSLKSRHRQEFWFLLRSDVHHDNVHCDWVLEKKHLDQARERGAGIIETGDTFCCMQGKWDPRSDQEQFRAEHRVPNYLDALQATAADFYAPYADLWVMMGYGNHETKVIDRHGTDLIQGLLAKMNDRMGTSITAGGYSGYVKFQFKRAAYRTSKTLWYHHGSGGSSPVTKGVNVTQKHAAFISDADVIVSGHTHTEFIVPTMRVSLSQSNKIEKRRQWHVKVPGYKDSWNDGATGWENEKGFVPTTTGAAWLHFVYENDNIDTNVYLAPN